MKFKPLNIEEEFVVEHHRFDEVTGELLSVEVLSLDARGRDRANVAVMLWMGLLTGFLIACGWNAFNAGEELPDRHHLTDWSLASPAA